MESPCQFCRLNDALEPCVKLRGPRKEASLKPVTWGLNEGLNDVDLLCLKRIRDHLQLEPLQRNPILWLNLQNVLGSGIRGIYFPWFHFPLSSSAFRYASLALGCAMDLNPAYSNYLDRFYMYVKATINTSSIMEVFISSYVALLCSLQTNDCFQLQTNERLPALLVYFYGVRSAFSELIKYPQINCLSILYDVMRSCWRTMIMAISMQTIWTADDITLADSIYQALKRTTYPSCPYSQHNLSIANIIYSEMSERANSTIHNQNYLPFAIQLDLGSGVSTISKGLLRELLESSREWEQLGDS